MQNETTAVTKAKIVSYRAHDNQDVTLDIAVCRQFLVRGKSELVTNQEFVFFMGICKSKALNPFAGDCFLVKYDQSPAAIIVARGHIQTRARQQPDCKGWNCGIAIIGEKGLEYREGHLILPGEELVGGWAKAKPEGWDEPRMHTVGLAAYIKRTREGRVTQFWSDEKQPMMIEKVAEVQLLRSLWSKEFANLYTEEEIADAMVPATPQVVQEDQPGDLSPEDLTRILREKKAAIEKQAAEEPRSGHVQPAEEDPEALDGDSLLEMKALVKTFDARIDQEPNIPHPFLQDFLFHSLAIIQESDTEHVIESIPELKAWIMKNRAFEKFIRDLEAYASRQAEKDLDEDPAGFAGACQTCKKELLEQEIVPLPNGEGGSDFYCIDCTPKVQPDKEEKPPEPPAEDEEAPDWKKGLDLDQLSDHTIVNSFINLRTSKDDKLGLKGWIRANPTWNSCSDFVRKKLIRKWGALYGGESLDLFMEQLAPAKAPEPDGFITEVQMHRLRQWADKKGIGWARLVQYSVAKGLAKIDKDSFGVEQERITEAGAAEMLGSLDRTFTDVVNYFKALNG